MLILIWHVTAGERRITSWPWQVAGQNGEVLLLQQGGRYHVVWISFITLNENACILVNFFLGILVNQEWRYAIWRLLAEAKPEAEQAYIHHVYCALSFLLCFCILFQRVIFLVSSHLTTPVTVLVLIQLCCCLIVMFIVTNFGDAKRTIKVWLSSGFIVIFFIRTYIKQLTKCCVTVKIIVGHNTLSVIIFVLLEICNGPFIQ